VARKLISPDRASNRQSKENGRRWKAHVAVPRERALDKLTTAVAAVPPKSGRAAVGPFPACGIQVWLFDHSSASSLWVGKMA